jgi:hypothetical protein
MLMEEQSRGKGIESIEHTFIALAGVISPKFCFSILRYAASVVSAVPGISAAVPNQCLPRR